MYAWTRFRVDEQMIKGYVTMQVEIYIKRSCANQDEGMRSIDKSMVMNHFRRQSAGQEAFSMSAQALGIGQFICTDLVPIPSLYSARNVTLYVEDANESDWGRQERFDLIHFRNMDGGIKDWEAAFKWAFNCQRAGGFLRLEQLVFYPPPDDPGPNSIWHALQQALDCIQAQKGLSFALQDAQGAQEKLEGSGYDIISNRTRPFHILPGMYVHDSCDLLWAIIELVKGVLVRGWELQPEVADKESLLSRLEVEFARGLEVKV
ncbi:hypothetical protein N0V84_007840 [Fusarium piperis]|uniref:Methyltransferase n=1 Tax=Fusarium piperis TaxID=1435070 RepID=A0A9W9BMW8_9HYPO|nr:hypothetical protein N0V84_007840 [Fusarium piperis]